MSKIGDFFGMFDKVDDIIYKPIETICEWTKEPLRRFDANREQRKSDQKFYHEMLEKRMEVDLEKTKKSIEVEIDELKDNRIIARNKKVLDTISEYRRSMLEDARDIYYNLSLMEIELSRQAHDLVIKKTQEYKKMQESARDDCDRRLSLIQEKYADNKRVKERQEDSVMDQCDEMIKQAGEFISQLKDDIVRINNNNSERINSASMMTNAVLKNLGGQLGNQIFNEIEEERGENFIEEKK